LIIGRVLTLQSGTLLRWCIETTGGRAALLSECCVLIPGGLLVVSPWDRLGDGLNTTILNRLAEDDGITTFIFGRDCGVDADIAGLNNGIDSFINHFNTGGNAGI
jgi:hypothetical protein